MKLKPIRTVTSLVIALSLVGAAAFAGPASAAASTTNTRYITISATGTTSVVPDAVRITATVSVLSASSKAALSSAGTTSNAVRNALTAKKVATKDIATQSISVFPEYSYPQNGTPTISGYRASQSFDITVRAASTAGAVVDAIVEAGGDNVQISGVSPFVINNDKATELARTYAVKRAKAKANSYAKLLGIKLGRVVYLDETSSPSVSPIYSTAAKEDSAATVVDLGEQKISVSVTVRWAIGK
jgi:uncharacterized protein YggE